MSLFSILHAVEPSSPEAALAAAFPGAAVTSESPLAYVTKEALHATARRSERTPFDLEVIGIHPNVSIYFALDKFRSAEARETLVTAVRNFLSTTHGDVVVKYLDDTIIKRIGTASICVTRYADMLPVGNADWTIVPEIE